MRRLPFLLLLICTACATSSGDRPAPSAARPGERTAPARGTQRRRRRVAAGSRPTRVREKRAEAFALAELWFAPGNRVRADDAGGWRVLSDGDRELYFGEPSTTPRLSFRFHTADEHLVGIALRHGMSVPPAA